MRFVIRRFFILEPQPTYWLFNFLTQRAWKLVIVRQRLFTLDYLYNKFLRDEVTYNILDMSVSKIWVLKTDWPTAIMFTAHQTCLHYYSVDRMMITLQITNLSLKPYYSFAKGQINLLSSWPEILSFRIFKHDLIGFHITLPLTIYYQILFMVYPSFL